MKKEIKDSILNNKKYKKRKLKKSEKKKNIQKIKLKIM